MNGPWGISGPAFAWIYAACAVLPAALAGLHAAWLRRGFHDGGRLPTVRHVAALAGGADRVTDTVIAALLEREQVRIAGSGRLYRTPLEPVDAVGKEIVELLPRIQGFRLRWYLSRGEAIRTLREDLADRGLLVPEGRRKVGWRIASVCYVVLFAAGLVEGIGSPTVLLAVLVAAVLGSAFAALRFGRTRHQGRPTRAGRRVLAEAAEDRGLVAGAPGAVALGGLSAYPDQALAPALTRTLTVTGTGGHALAKLRRWPGRGLSRNTYGGGDDFGILMAGLGGSGGHSCGGGGGGGSDGGGGSG
ncbi:TIGR04222 domain-containing membrane protein [Amycolatopsis sp. lyj-112]|uniref:TIGR04222 domain-containing membrane protein n=1 Tax=Amycolatopsis sp. lyj-112 TaxID=2789288 RepID=UPI00397B8E3C